MVFQLIFSDFRMDSLYAKGSINADRMLTNLDDSELLKIASEALNNFVNINFIGYFGKIFLKETIDLANIVN